MKKYLLVRFGGKVVSKWIILILDIFFVCSSFFFAHSLRFNFDLAQMAHFPMFRFMGIVSICYAFGFIVFTPFAGIIRHTGLVDILRIIYANLSGLGVSLIFYGFSFLNEGFELFRVPLSILIIHFFVVTFLMSIVRFAIRSFYRVITNKYPRPKNVLIYGAGSEGIKTKNIIEQDSTLRYKVIGFVDDKGSKIGMTIDGLPIYSPRKLSKLFLEHIRIEEVIVAIQGISSGRKQKVLNQFVDSNIKVKNVPPANQWIDGEFQPNQLQDIKIEDLLGRNPIRLDHIEVREQIKGRVVLVTGAAGSIGSEISRQVMHYKPSKLVLLDKSESPLHDLITELQHESKFVDGLKIVPALCDIRSIHRLSKIFQQHQPEVIYHAAAYKHVPMMENHPYEAIRSNVLGTRNTVQLAIDYKARDFVMVSTDKAVNPTNVMGASKRMAELYCQHLQHHARISIITTRFGNVLGSSGSVIPLFKRQIQKGRAITITHPEVTRYFMTIPEASELVLEAGAMGDGGEIFVFDMGESIKMVDLVKKLIKVCGKSESEVDINFIGLRPGEKLYEELLSNDEETKETYHAKIRIVRGKEIPHINVIKRIDNLLENIDSLEDVEIVREMKAIVPEYRSNNSVYEELDNEMENAMIS